MQNMSGGKSALGMDGNITALLGYIVGIVAIISIIMEKDNKFVRFHSLQSVLWSVACLIGFFAILIIGGILGLVLVTVSSTLGGIVWTLTILLYVGMFFVLFGGLIYGAIKSYGGSMFKLPIVGNLAEKWS